MYSLLFVYPFTGEELEFDRDKYISKSILVFKIKKVILSFLLRINILEGVFSKIRAINK